jgi:hypothetical protein
LGAFLFLRAEKFGVEYKEPAEVRHDLRFEARKERMTRQGFATGIDIFRQAVLSGAQQQKQCCFAALVWLPQRTLNIHANTSS